jgi:hypothetical protein
LAFSKENRFMQKELGIGSRIKHTEFGDGVVTNVKTNHYKIVFIQEGPKEISKDSSLLQVIEAVDSPEDLISNAEMERTLIGILKRWTEIPESVSLHGKWTGGKIILQPADPHLSGKEIPIDTFFHKIVMLRDRLRVMEQRINSNDKLNDEDKINLQQYLTKIYGSLTTFNVLFKYQHDYFVGEKSKED